MEHIDYSWKPRPSDIQWTHNLFRFLNDGGTWVIPMNGSIWRHDKVNKLLVCTVGKVDDMFHKISVCCESLGYVAVLKADMEQALVISPDTFGTTKSSTRITRQYLG